MLSNEQSASSPC